MPLSLETPLLSIVFFTLALLPINLPIYKFPNLKIPSLLIKINQLRILLFSETCLLTTIDLFIIFNNYSFLDNNVYLK